MKHKMLFGIQFDALRKAEMVDLLLSWVQNPASTPRYVVTPNVDHTILFQKMPELRKAYQHASLVTADGRPVVWASKWVGRALPECVPGSDLVPALFDRADSEHELRVFLLGAGLGVADRAAVRIHERWPGVRVTGTYSPPMGFEKDAHENQAIIQRVNQSDAHVLVIGLGAPKQELWIHHNQSELRVPVALCVGATIDFLAEEKKRAPKWMRGLALEWFHRMMSEPRRLGPRYLRDAWHFPQLVLRQFLQDRRTMPPG